jgi:hypothetical protein
MPLPVPGDSEALIQHFAQQLAPELRRLLDAAAHVRR